MFRNLKEETNDTEKNYFTKNYQWQSKIPFSCYEKFQRFWTRNQAPLSGELTNTTHIHFVCLPLVAILFISLKTRLRFKSKNNSSQWTATLSSLIRPCGGRFRWLMFIVECVFSTVAPFADTAKPVGLISICHEALFLSSREFDCVQTVECLRVNFDFIADRVQFRCSRTRVHTARLTSKRDLRRSSSHADIDRLIWIETQLDIKCRPWKPIPTPPGCENEQNHTFPTAASSTPAEPAVKGRKVYDDKQ